MNSAMWLIISVGSLAALVWVNYVVEKRRQRRIRGFEVEVRPNTGASPVLEEERDKEHG